MACQYCEKLASTGTSKLAHSKSAYWNQKLRKCTCDREMSATQQQGSAEGVTGRPLSLQQPSSLSVNQDALDLVQMVDDLLDDISTRFASVSAEILTKMDDMATRIDNLEASILARDAQDEANRTPKK